MDPATLAVKDQEVAFDRLESMFFGFPSSAHQVFNPPHRGFVDQLSVEQVRLRRANDAAPRPVNRDLLAQRAAKKTPADFALMSSSALTTAPIACPLRPPLVVRVKDCMAASIWFRERGSWPRMKGLRSPMIAVKA